MNIALSMLADRLWQRVWHCQRYSGCCQKKKWNIKV